MYPSRDQVEQRVRALQTRRVPSRHRLRFIALVVALAGGWASASAGLAAAHIQPDLAGAAQIQEPLDGLKLQVKITAPIATGVTPVGRVCDGDESYVYGTPTDGSLAVTQIAPSSSGWTVADDGQFGFFIVTPDVRLRALIVANITARSGNSTLTFTIGTYNYGCASLGNPVSSGTAFVVGAQLHSSDGTPSPSPSCGDAAFQHTGNISVLAVSFRSCVGSPVAPPSTKPAPPTAHCLPYIVIDTRGSGEPYETSPPGAKFLGELQRLKGAANVGLIRNPYPAKGNLSLAGAYFSVPQGYHNSVVAGKNWLRNELAKETATCASSNTKFFLTGYSQGAQVVGDVYQERLSPSIVGVALFGDPYFNNRDGYVDRGSPAYAPNLYGSLGRRPIFDSLRKRHVLSFCHQHDPICQGSNRDPLTIKSLAQYGTYWHKNYDTRGEPERAADYFANLSG